MWLGHRIKVLQVREWNVCKLNRSLCLVLQNDTCAWYRVSVWVTESECSLHSIEVVCDTHNKICTCHSAYYTEWKLNTYSFVLIEKKISKEELIISRVSDIPPRKRFPKVRSITDVHPRAQKVVTTRHLRVFFLQIRKVRKDKLF